MIRKQVLGHDLSALAFGAMRLPVLESGAIDREAVHAMVDFAIGAGINYFDTAWAYHGGESESVMGESLSRFPRDSFCLATKFPGYEQRERWDPAEVFEEQLRKCRVGHFDFYLLHNVYERNLATYLDDSNGIVRYLLDQREAGRIRHLGFSAHAREEAFMAFLKAHGPKMEFCMIELNALDWTLQNARLKYETLKGMGLPVFVMEPLRGGLLASLSPENEARLRAMRPDESVPAWAFRWLQGLPGLGVILSGMSSMAQLRENVGIFANERPLAAPEREAYEAILQGLGDMVPCTNCRYCVADCPEGLDIPTFIGFYNDCRVAPSGIVRMAVDGLKPSKRPSACVSCGTCVGLCPQGIDIPEALKDLTAILDKIPSFLTPATEEG
ncbi:MAG: aldo/keto reductase [Deltaproteobacteria bacterium]|jgi:predicted aldo/keto reductase-like oxidoreductase|nr:aldo/keto reductase [Deltaproteobacteria bacterium]